MYYQKSNASKELFLYIVNTENIYFSSVLPTIKSLAKKKDYDISKATTVWYRVTTLVAKGYSKKFPLSDYIFNVTSRWTTAIDLERYYRDDVMENR